MRFLPVDWRTNRLLWRSLPRPFRGRIDQRAVWQKRYTEAEMSSVDALLRVVCDAFGFSSDDRYFFSPNDTVAEVYRACYPRWQFWSIGDNMEIESLLAMLESHFHIKDSRLHAEIGLGEIVAIMLATNVAFDSLSSKQP